MIFNSLEEFIVLAKSGPRVIDDYEYTSSRLSAMLMVKNDDSSQLLNHWIAAVSTKLALMKPLYEAALSTKTLPLDELIEIHTKLKALTDG